MSSYNWSDIAKSLGEQVGRDGKFSKLVEVADFLGIPQSTVRGAFGDGRLSYRQLVGLDLPSPLAVSVNGIGQGKRTSLRDNFTVLFITDLHVGYKLDGLGNRVPIHSRRFVENLLEVARVLSPSIVVWGGDLLDLPDFGRYTRHLDIVGHTQAAIIEAGFILGKFASVVGYQNQVLLEGNHEARLYREITKHIPELSELKSTTSNYPVASVPHLLDLEILGVDWYGGWPNNRFIIGNDVVFEHGSIVRPSAGKTAAALAERGTHSLFFGHVHRTELVRRLLPLSTNPIWVGCPGCGCRVDLVPGVGRLTDWHIGAFLITLDHRGDISAVDLITQTTDGSCVVRGEEYLGVDYVEELTDNLPPSLRK